MNNNQTTKIIKRVLSEITGAEEEDIRLSDSFREDYHMSSVDIADFIEKLQSSGIDTSKIEISEMQTLEDLVEFVGEEDF